VGGGPGLPPPGGVTAPPGEGKTPHVRRSSGTTISAKNRWVQTITIKKRLGTGQTEERRNNEQHEGGTYGKESGGGKVGRGYQFGVTDRGTYVQDDLGGNKRRECPMRGIQGGVRGHPETLRTKKIPKKNGQKVVTKKNRGDYSTVRKTVGIIEENKRETGF